MSMEENFIDVTYAEAHHPYTQYPNRLARHLKDRFRLPAGGTILDVGCGRGEYLQGFSLAGLKVSGVDRSPNAQKLCPEAQIRTADIANEPLPFPDGSFDVVFNKSVIEHMYYPEKLVAEMRRVLKPGGLLLTLTPDWLSQYKIFYEDFTHRTPFTLASLGDILAIHDFKNVRVERFRQLPFLWKWPFLAPFCALLGAVMPRSSVKLIRFSQEVMLLAAAEK